MSCVRLCVRCGGSGEYLGIGMMMKTCELCNNNKKEVVNKKSKHYKEAINAIISSSSKKLSKSEAEQIFDKTYESL